MAMKYLGETYDIHTSSRELVFPHHENEIAIAGAVTGKPLARFWIHCDRVLVHGKIVDEQGAGETLSDLTNMGYTGREVRYWLISGHYRKPITFSKERLEDTKRSLKRLDSCINSLIHLKSDGSPFPELDQLLYDIKQGFISAMDDDLNISAAMASIFKNVKKVNILILGNKLDTNDASKILDAFRNLDSVLKIFHFEDAVDAPDVQRLIKEREKARVEKNWKLADKLRDQLEARGITIKDSKISN